MTPKTNNTYQKPLWEILITAISQIILLLFGGGLAFILADGELKYAHYFLIELLPFFILFTLFDISYHRDKPWLLKLAFVAAAAIYITMALCTYSLYAAFFWMLIISSGIIAFGYARYKGGREKDYIRAFTPLILTIIQALLLFVISNYYTSVLYYKESYFVSISETEWIEYVHIGSTLFLVISLIANVATLKWDRWWIIAITAFGMALLSTYLCWESDFFVVRVAVITVSVYMLGVLLSYLINHPTTKSNNCSIKSITTTPKKISNNKIAALSIVQTMIVFVAGNFFIASLLSALYLIYNAFYIIAHLILFFAFNIACNNRNKTIQITVVALFAMLYFTMVIDESAFLLDNYFMVAISPWMIALSYAKFTARSFKEHFRIFAPLIVTTLQITILLNIISHYIEMFKHKEFALVMLKHISIYYQSLFIGCFYIIATTSNYLVVMWNRWWIYLLISIMIMTLTFNFFIDHEYFIWRAPIIVGLVYGAGIVVAFLIKLLLAKSKPQIFKASKQTP